jgi:hypothetical protein
MRQREPAISGLIVGGTALLGQLVTNDPPDCIAKTQKYEAFVGNNPQQVELLVMPGTDGKSILSADKEAPECGIDEETLRKMAQS